MSSDPPAGAGRGRGLSLRSLLQKRGNHLSVLKFSKSAAILKYFFLLIKTIFSKNPRVTISLGLAKLKIKFRL